MLRTFVVRAAYRLIDALWPEPATAPSIRHPAHQGLGYARWCDTHLGDTQPDL